MSIRTAVRSWPAIGLGALAILATAYVLLEDVARGTAPFTTSHLLTIVTLAVTVAAGHWFLPELRRGAILFAAGLAVIFTAGTAYTVASSGARNAEALATKIAAASNTNAERARVMKLRDRAQAMADEASRRMAAECATGKGKKCDGTKATFDVYAAAIKGHDADLARLGPEKPASTYRHVAEVFKAIPGVTAEVDDLEHRLTLLMPFATVLICELSVLVFIGLGLGQKPPADPVPGNVQRPVPTNVPGMPRAPTPPNGGRRGRKADAAVVNFSEAFSRKHGRAPSGSEIKAQFPDLPTSTAYDYAARARATTGIKLRAVA